MASVSDMVLSLPLRIWYSELPFYFLRWAVLNNAQLMDTSFAINHLLPFPERIRNITLPTEWKDRRGAALPTIHTHPFSNPIEHWNWWQEVPPVSTGPLIPMSVTC